MRLETKNFWTRYNKAQQASQDEEITNLEGSLYAILFNSQEDRHSRDMKFVYNSLIRHGVKTGNIITLEGNGYTKNRFVNMPATFGALDYSIDFIRQIAKPNDKLLVYTTNASNIVNGQCMLSAYGGMISEKEFEKLAKDLTVNFAVFYFSSRHSGGFAERVGYKNNIGISSVSFSEVAHSWCWRGADFTYSLFPKILKKGVSIEKAFDHAVFMNTNIFRRTILKSKETPQLRWQNADPSKLCLGLM